VHQCRDLQLDDWLTARRLYIGGISEYVRLAVLLSFTSLSALGQQPTQQAIAGVIRGVVVWNDGTPAAEIRLTASPLGVPIMGVLPSTRTDQNGNYRFDKLAWLGRYTVYADDPDAGYSSFSTGPAGPGHPPEATISPEHPEATLDLRLPPKAGFLQIHLTNKLTGAVISGLGITVMSNQSPPKLIFSLSCSSDRAVLVPPDRDLLLHITSSGFHEWDESKGRGKPIRVPRGGHVELGVQLTLE
jgi:hypothetical protein